MAFYSFSFHITHMIVTDQHVVLIEKYLQECWPIVKGALKEHGIACELNLVSNSSCFVSFLVIIPYVEALICGITPTFRMDERSERRSRFQQKKLLSLFPLFRG